MADLSSFKFSDTLNQTELLLKTMRDLLVHIGKRDCLPNQSVFQRITDYAIGQLLNYNQQQDEPTTLTQFVEAHRLLRLSQEDFQHFGEALIRTFEIELPHNEMHQRTMAALEIVIWPGIFYMMQQCAPAQPAN